MDNTQNNGNQTQSVTGTTALAVHVVGNPVFDYEFGLRSDGGIYLLDLTNDTTIVLYDVQVLQFTDMTFELQGDTFVVIDAQDTSTDETDTADEETDQPAEDAVSEEVVAETAGNSGTGETTGTDDAAEITENTSNGGNIGDDFSDFFDGDDFPPVDDGCVPGVDHDVIYLTEDDKGVKAEFDFKIKKQILEFQLELKIKDGELGGFGDDLEFVDMDFSMLEAAMADAGVQNITVNDIEIKDDKIKLKIGGDFALSKEDSDDMDLYLPNEIDLAITVSDYGVLKDICVKIEPDFDAHSPIALDLNGDGEIGVTGATSSREKDADAQLGDLVEFDIDADGKLDTIEWFDGSGDGILVDLSKIKADGTLDGSALFGDEGGRFENGYDKLKNHDTDGNGTLTGAELDGLGLWIDDGDAVLEAGEMMSIAEAGVAEISTDMNLVQDDDGKTLMQSSATLDDGTMIVTEDVWFDGVDLQAMMADLNADNVDTCDHMDMEDC